MFWIDKMKILFWLRKNKMNSRGEASLICRITVDGIRCKEFSTGQSCKPTEWNASRQSCRNELVNIELNNIKLQIQKIKIELNQSGREFSAQLIADIFQGKQKQNIELLELYDQFYIKATTKQKDRTLMRYRSARKILQNYLAQSKQLNLEAEKFTIKQGRLFLDHLQTNLKNSIEVSHRTVKLVKCVLQYGLQQGFTQTNPMYQWKGEKGKDKPIVTLTLEEVATIEQTILCKRLRQVADLFLFQCYTGLDYGDTQTFRIADHIRKDPDGKAWIIKPREKNGETAFTPLLPEPRELLNRYEGLPRISNQKYNAYLKEIAEACKIDKHLTTHIGRKTFGTLVLNKGFTIEAVSKMMGHRYIRTTQRHYARVDETRVMAEVVLMTG